MSAFSSPVLAGRCSLSGLQSGNLSRMDEMCIGKGLSPGYWMNHLEDWVFISPFDSFHPTFSGSYLDGFTMIQVLQTFNSNGKIITAPPFSSLGGM